jgi:hypothetical protein
MSVGGPLNSPPLPPSPSLPPPLFSLRGVFCWILGRIAYPDGSSYTVSADKRKVPRVVKDGRRSPLADRRWQTDRQQRDTLV